MEDFITDYRTDSRRFVRRIMCKYLAHLPFVDEDNQERLKASFAPYSRPHNIIFNDTLLSKLMRLQTNSGSRDAALLAETEFVVNLVGDGFVDADGNFNEEGNKKYALQLQKRKLEQEI